eukprot:scaffold1902_cov115-Amphora_coffeaeformis.AAC.2
MEYKTFRDMKRTTRIPPGYQQIPLRMVFDVKQTLKQMAQLNGLHLTGGDIGNAYLEAYTNEKVCTIAGYQPELDVTMELGTDDIMKFQSMIGAVQVVTSFVTVTARSATVPRLM